jgi:hypothetical protein
LATALLVTDASHPADVAFQTAWVLSKVIGVPLDSQAAGPQNRAKLLAEVTVGEIDAAQAARS